MSTKSFKCPICGNETHHSMGAIVRDDIEGFWWAPDYEEIYLYELSRK